jgi:hypothetical protein
LAYGFSGLIAATVILLLLLQRMPRAVASSA